MQIPNSFPNKEQLIQEMEEREISLKLARQQERDKMNMLFN